MITSTLNHEFEAWKNWLLSTRVTLKSASPKVSQPPFPDPTLSVRSPAESLPICRRARSILAC
jgi:hypothetical protein